MLKETKVSILVPCYNVQKYVKQCMDSLINQTLKEIEIIAINDGSTDNTLQILQDYAARDARIIIIDKANEGYGKSMNLGLNKARGKYIGIVESDDWAELDMFEVLYKLAEKNHVQVVKSAHYSYSNGKNKKTKFLADSELDRVIDPKIDSSIFYYQPSIWSALYERAFLEKYQINFLESPGASYQDVGFNFKVWAMASRVYYTPRTFIHYREDNVDSSVKSKNKIFCVCDEWENIEDYLSKYPIYKKSSLCLRSHVKLGNYIWNLHRLKGDSQEAFRKRFAYEYKKLLLDKVLKKDCFSTSRYLKLMRVLFPESLKWKACYWGQKILRPIIKDVIKSNRKYYKICFGLLSVGSVEAKLPSFIEEPK